MPPIRIKYYGLIPMTKQTYLLTLGLSAFVATAVLTIFVLLGRAPPFDTMWSRDNHLRSPGIWALIHNYMWWIIVVCVIGQAFDTWLTLRAFAKKEAEQRSLSGSTAVRAGEPPSSGHIG